MIKDIVLSEIDVVDVIVVGNSTLGSDFVDWLDTIVADVAVVIKGWAIPVGVVVGI